MNTIGSATKKPTATPSNTHAAHEANQGDTNSHSINASGSSSPTASDHTASIHTASIHTAGGSSASFNPTTGPDRDRDHDHDHEVRSTARNPHPMGSKSTTSNILWLARIAFVVALAVTVAFPEWEQFAGKGMAFRVPFYALPMGIVPLVWKLRGSHGDYPWLVDLLVFSPFFVDTLGNVFNFYNNFNQTDDVLHFGNWVLLMGGITIGFGRLHLGKLVSWTLGWGLGALAIIWWEVAEFLVQEMGTAGLSLTYQDTVGDLVLSSTGGAVGAFLAVTFAWPSSRPEDAPLPS